MDRRRFFVGAGGLGLVATGCTAQTNTRQAASVQQSEDGVQSSVGVVIHPWESEVMRAFPPTPGNQVTRENHEESHDKLRWAMQHWRELFPTQRVSRGVVAHRLSVVLQRGACTPHCARVGLPGMASLPSDSNRIQWCWLSSAVSRLSTMVRFRTAIGRPCAQSVATTNLNYFPYRRAGPKPFVTRC